MHNLAFNPLTKRFDATSAMIIKQMQNLTFLPTSLVMSEKHENSILLRIREHLEELLDKQVVTKLQKNETNKSIANEKKLPTVTNTHQPPISMSLTLLAMALFPYMLVIIIVLCLMYWLFIIL